MRIEPVRDEVFDIETRGQQGLSVTLGIQEKIDSLEEMEVDDLQSFAAEYGFKLGNRNKRESIYTFLVETLTKMVGKAALKLYGAEVYAIAYAPLSGGKVHAMAVTEELPERELLERYLKHLEEPRLMIGFNIRGFDLPVLCTRAAFHGLHWPTWLPSTQREDRYNTDVVFDLMDVLSEGPLDTWLRVFGLPPKTGSAAKAPDMSPREVAQYCADDVERERMLARKVIMTTKYRGMVE